MSVYCVVCYKETVDKYWQGDKTFIMHHIVIYDIKPWGI